MRQHAGLRNRVEGAPHDVKTDVQLPNALFRVAQKFKQGSFGVMVVQTVGSKTHQHGKTSKRLEQRVFDHAAKSPA